MEKHPHVCFLVKSKQAVVDYDTGNIRAFCSGGYCILKHLFQFAFVYAYFETTLQRGNSYRSMVVDLAPKNCQEGGFLHINGI